MVLTAQKTVEVPQSPPVVVMFVQSALVVEYVMPILVVTYAHASPVVEYVTPTLTVAYVARVTTRTAATTVFSTATMSCPLLWLWHAKPQLQRPWGFRRCFSLTRLLTCSFVVRRQVLMVLTVLKTVQDPQLQFIDNFVASLSLFVQRQALLVLTMQNSVEKQQLQIFDKVVDMPAVVQRQASVILIVQKARADSTGACLGQGCARDRCRCNNRCRCSRQCRNTSRIRRCSPSTRP